MLNQLKSMQQRLVIRDLALSKVTSQGIPIAKLLSQVATTLDQDNQPKFERWRELVVDIQSAFQKESTLVAQLSDDLSEKSLQAS